MLQTDDNDNTQTYAPVADSGLGAVHCLGCEAYGRWRAAAVKLVRDLVRERSRLLLPHVRRGTALGLQHRWRGILPISLQKCVERGMLEDDTVDLHEALLEPIPGLADLPILA